MQPFLLRPNMISRPVLSRALPFAVFLVFLACDPLIADGLAHFSVEARWSYLFRIVAAGCCLLWFWHEYRELWMEALPPMREVLVALGLGLLVLLLWLLPYPAWLTQGLADNPSFLQANGEPDWWWVCSRMVGSVLVVPLMEELFWRSFLMRWVEASDFRHVPPRSVSRRALLISALLFGLMHDLWLAGILAGIAYGQLYRQSGNLWLPIIAHAVTNLGLGIWVVYAGQWQYW
jgi:CAAX prenyl protease-like protein